MYRLLTLSLFCVLIWWSIHVFTYVFGNMYTTCQKHAADIIQDDWLYHQCQTQEFTTHLSEYTPRCKMITLRKKMGALWFTLYNNIKHQKMKEWYLFIHRAPVWLWYTLLFMFVLGTYCVIVYRRKNKIRLPYISVI